MERDMNQSAAAAIPTLCRGGCGFYGSSSTEGFCSKCFKDALKRKQDPARHSPASGSSTASAASKSATAGLATDLTCRSNSINGETNKVSTVPGIVETSAHDFPASIATTAAASDQSQDVLAKPERTTEANKTCSDDLTIPHTLTATASSSDVTTTNNSATITPDPDLHKSSSFPSQKPYRCFQCNKKVGFTGFDCRCGFIFCGVHRYSDMHNCTFDYKSMGADEIRKNNPVVKGEKIQKL